MDVGDGWAINNNGDLQNYDPSFKNGWQTKVVKAGDGRGIGGAGNYPAVVGNDGKAKILR